MTCDGHYKVTTQNFSADADRQIQAMKTEMSSARFNMTLEVRKILNPEQQKKFKGFFRPGQS